MPDTIQITRPDDWHIHVRSGAILETVVPHSARCFGRIMVMPNLAPPVCVATRADQYRDEILAASAGESHFNPQMSLYLTDNTSVENVLEADKNPNVVGFKLYPAGATTNSDSGVTSVSRIMPILEAIASTGLVLQVHGEVTDPNVDVFDREAEFIDQVLQPLQREIPELRVVFEHITTRQGVEFVRSAGDNVGATITPQHLMFSRNDMFSGGIRPHYYCLPILKRHEHRLALLEAATDGDTSFFLGTDSAPHTRLSKESSCGCAGIYSAHAAIELYAEVFEAMDALDRLEAFASFHGADFYRQPRNSDKITLERIDWEVPRSYQIAGHRDTDLNDPIVPLRAGEIMRWRLLTEES